MSLRYMIPASKFKRYLPKDYVELVDYGPFGKEYSEVGVKNMGTFKELVEEHPMCSGCWMAYYIKIIFAALPNPENTEQLVLLVVGDLLFLKRLSLSFMEIMVTKMQWHLELQEHLD